MTKIKIPRKTSMKFNEEILHDGAVVRYRYEVNDHDFLALVREYGPNMLRISDAFTSSFIGIEEVLSGICEIIPVVNDDNLDEVIECTLFDSDKIPINSVYVDPDGLTSMVHESADHYLTVVDYMGRHSDIQAEILFHLFEEGDEGYLIYPPLYIGEQQEIAKEMEEDSHDLF